MSDTTCIKIYSTRSEAELAKTLLESHEIESMISADDCGGFRPYLASTTGGVKLLVLEEMAEEAKKILE